MAGGPELKRKGFLKDWKDMGGIGSMYRKLSEPGHSLKSDPMLKRFSSK